MIERVATGKKIKDNPFRTVILNERTILLMTHDIPSDQTAARSPELGAKLEQLVTSLPGPEPGARSKRGRPVSVSAWHLSLAVLVSLMRGLQHQSEVWRLIAFFGIGGLPPVAVTDQAIYTRLEQDGVKGFQASFAHLSQWLAQRLAPYEHRQLAPFATAVLALDESVLDQVKRWVRWLREVPKGDSRLLPGRLVGLFDVRLQQWRRLEVLLDATANCKVHARAMLHGLAKGTLLLFDRGYFSFAWLDDLSQLGFWYVSRLVSKTSYQVEHIHYQADGVFDALVYLGKHRADRAGELVRLVRFRIGSQHYCYVTNVLDPTLLSLAQIAQLYARRWDIELAFRELKEHLGLHLLWSAKLGVIYQQIWASLLLAQLVHAFQVELAAQAEVDPFDISLALLTRYVPRLLLQGENPLEFLLTHGRAMGVIRPSTRTRIQAPTIPLWAIQWPPPDLLQSRAARYAQRKCQSRYAAQS